MTIEITSVATLLEAIKSTKITSRSHTHVRLWFRGHGNSSYKLEPGVYRNGFIKDEDEDDDDERRKRRERHLTQDFQALGAPLLGRPMSDAEIYFIQQHYRMPTRLLDWSLNPLAALFFAVESGSTDDGTFFVLDAYSFSKGRGLCTPRSQEVRDAMAAIFTWKDADEGRPLWPTKILAVRPFNIDPRIAGQRGCFTFHPPDQRELDPNHKALKRFLIPAKAKKSLREEVDLLGFDEFTIYNDLDNLSKRLRRAHTDP